MIECPIPQDVLKYKAKFIANFTAREAAFLLLGGLSGVFAYTVLFANVTGNARIYLTAPFFLIFFAFGFIKPLGQPLEVILTQVVIDNFFYPAYRYYEIRHPEFEKFHEKRDFEIALSEEELEKRRKKRKKKKDNEIKIKRSKTHKAIH